MKQGVKMVERLLRWTDAWNKRLGQLCAVLLLLMTIIGALNAVLRYIGKSMGQNLTSNAMIEIQWQLFSVSFLLGAAYVLREDKHVRVDVLYGKLTRKRKIWIDLIGSFVFLIPFCLFGIWSSWNYVSNSWALSEVSSAAGGLPLYPIKTLIPMSFFLLLLQGLFNALRAFLFLQGGENES